MEMRRPWPTVRLALVAGIGWHIAPENSDATGSYRHRTLNRTDLSVEQLIRLGGAPVKNNYA